MQDNKDNRHLIKDDEELEKLFARAMHLYKKITDMALENEQNN